MNVYERQASFRVLLDTWVCWLCSTSFLKKTVFTLDFADAIRLFPPSFQALAACGKAMIDSITTAFPSVPQVQSAFFQRDPSSPAILLGVNVAILSLCLLLNLQQPLENLEVNTPRVLMTIDRTGECTMRLCWLLRPSVKNRRHAPKQSLLFLILSSRRDAWSKNIGNRQTPVC